MEFKKIKTSGGNLSIAGFVLENYYFEIKNRNPQSTMLELSNILSDYFNVKITWTGNHSLNGMGIFINIISDDGYLLDYKDNILLVGRKI